MAMALNIFKITIKDYFSRFEEKRKLLPTRNFLHAGILIVCCLMLAYTLLPFLLRNDETLHKTITPYRGNFSDETAENGYSTTARSHLELAKSDLSTPKDRTHQHVSIETSLPPTKPNHPSTEISRPLPTDYNQTSTTNGYLSTGYGASNTENNRPVTASVHVTLENGTSTTENNRPVTPSVHVTLENGTKWYIVNTPTCKIPDLDLWHETIYLLSNISYYKKCHERNSWMYTEGQDLVVNKTAIKQSKHKWENIRCCFRVMERVSIAKKDSPAKGYYPHDTDNRVKYSGKCFPITADRVKINTEFIRVFCYSNLTDSFDEVLFRLHFALVNPESRVLKKIEKWKALREQKKADAESVIPPNVVVFGIDTVSRLQSRRRFTKTLTLLEELGAVEMVGYAKVGENTHPNMVAFYTGLYVDELKNVCLKNDFYQPQDDCPYIWKGFDKADYVTVFAEDTTGLESGFNYLKLGFREKPTDFYFRPFVKRSYSDSMHNTSGQCTGSFSRSELTLNYVSDVLKRGSGGSPVFVHSWLATRSHDSPNDITFLEEPSNKFIQSLDLENTILIVLSDHFVRQGKFRETTLGWYEDRLPLLWIYLPSRVKAKFPEWNEALEINSKRLTSPFDLYQTFVHILKSFGNGVNYTEPLDIGNNFTKKGNTLFEPISENRTCSQAGIPLAYCPCQEYQSLEVGKEIVGKAVQFSLLYIHQSLPAYCSNFTVKTIEHAKHANFIGEAKKKVVEMFVVGFITDPGSFKFEASVQGKWDMYHQKYNFKRINSLEDILRVDKISTNVSCIKDSVLERYCYCL